MLNREDIFAADDLKTENVPVTEWDGSVLVRGLTGEERDMFESESISMKGKDVQVNHKNLRARLVALTVVNEDGSRMFSKEDAVELGKKSASALDKVFSVAQRLSGLSGEDVEQLVKNSEPTTSEDSSSL